jgi:hypothetical protein
MPSLKVTMKNSNWKMTVLIPFSSSTLSRPTLCIEVAGESMDDAANIVENACTKNDNQKFLLILADWNPN